MSFLHDAQDIPPAAHCAKCGGEIYPRESIFIWEQRHICRDCFKYKVLCWLELSPEQVANAMNVSHYPA